MGRLRNNGTDRRTIVVCKRNVNFLLTATVLLQQWHKVVHSTLELGARGVCVWESVGTTHLESGLAAMV